MPEGYCVKCKAKKEISDAVEEVMKNGRKAIKGKCPTCGTVMFKILGGKAVVTESVGAGPDSAPAPVATPISAPASGDAGRASEGSPPGAPGVNGPSQPKT